MKEEYTDKIKCDAGKMYFRGTLIFRDITII